MSTKKTKVFATPEKARRAGVQILYSAPSGWERARKRGFEALRGGGRAVWRLWSESIWWIFRLILICAGICAILAAATAFFPVLAGLVLGIVAIWFSRKAGRA